MNYYEHIQNVQSKQLEGERRYREREQREIILQQQRTKRKLSLWRVLWAWFVARRQAQDYDEMLHIFITLLQPRKAKIVQNIQQRP